MLWRGSAAWVFLPVQMVDFVLRFSSQPRLPSVWAKPFTWRSQMALAGNVHTILRQVGLPYPASPVQSRW